LHDPTVEGLEMALYLDGSGSMQEEYEPRTQSRTLGQWWRGEPATTLPNQVEPQAQWMLEYLATKDRNGVLRVAYWACGASGREIEAVGDLTGANARSYGFPGPRQMGRGTYLEPAMRDYMNYLKNQIALGARRGCAVFITDGALHDAEAVKAYSRELAREIAAGRLPRLNFILVGVGDAVDEEKMEDICQEE